MNSPIRIAIVGSGPAGLMAATEILRANSDRKKEVHLFERRSGLGRKLLIAGSSGLNISHQLEENDFAAHYQGLEHAEWVKLFKQFGKNEWIQFIEKELGLETFLGTSQRYFVREMKASGLLKRGITVLEGKGLQVHTEAELFDFKSGDHGVELSFLKGKDRELQSVKTDYAIFALGGASWETEIPSWAALFQTKAIQMVPFEASNVGYEINWDQKFLKESEGKALKKVKLKSKRGEKLGEMVITEYGLEGTPIYFCGTPGPATLDLKPDLNEAEIFQRLSKGKENFSPMRRVKHFLSLSEAAESLIFHHAPLPIKSDLKALIHYLKNFPLELLRSRPLSEAISSRGGVGLSELSPTFELKSFKGIFCIGEMLAWDAPTGGFLIQACISQGAYVGSFFGVP